MKALVCTLAAALLVSGCAGTSNSGNSASTDSKAVAPGAARPAEPPERSQPDGKTQPVRLAPAQAIIYTANLTVRVDNVTGVASQAKQLVTAAGGYVGGENTVNEPGSPTSADVTFKVPAAQYAAVLDQLGSSRIGRRLSLRQQAQDVTQDVADVNSRVASAKATLASFRDLLHRTTDVGQIVQIEQEIATRESDLESLQARQRSLSRETAFATIAMRIEGPAARAATRSGGLGKALASGWHAFTAFLGGVAVVIAVTLPFLALAALLGVPALWLVRRRRRSAETA
jgi:hypothetical protein